MRRFLLTLLLAAALPSHAAITFDGSANSDHYALSGANHISQGSSSWTAMFRMRCTSWTVAGGVLGLLMENYQTVALDGVLFGNDPSGNLVLAMFDNGVTGANDTSDHTLSLNTNYNVALAYGNNGTAELYVNGVQEASVATPNGIAFDDFFFGGGNGQASACSYEAVKTWTAKLSQAEVLAEQASITAVRTSNLHDTWRFTAYNATSYTGTANGKVMSNLSAGDIFLSSDLDIVTQEQEGFRWGVDDGNEAAHTFEANQDTSISIADTQSRLLRVLVNATTGDPASTAYTLRAQKNGAGGYAAVPITSTPTTTITNQPIGASADDAQQSGSTVTINGSTVGASLDATTEYVGLRFQAMAIPAGATITTAYVRVVPSGTGEDEPLVTIDFQAADDCAAFTTTNNDITGRSLTGNSVSWSSADLSATGATYHNSPSLVTPLQAVINRGGWTTGNDVCVVIQGGSTATRDLTIEAYDLGPGTNPPQIFVDYTTPAQVYVTASGNIASGGEATTARLTAPSGKSTSDFVTGRRWDNENGSDSIDITTDDYTEVEWLVFMAASLNPTDYYDFRVYAGSSALDTYTVTPRWTIPSSSSALLGRRRRN